MSPNWPPPTIGESADKLCDLLQIAEAYVDHLKTAIEDACKKEGHIWDNPEGTYRIVNEGGTWADPDPDTFCSQGGWVGGQDTEYYVRTCMRCGFTEKRRAKTVTPFT